MTEHIKISEEKIKETDSYLRGYGFSRKLIMLRNYEEKYFDTCEWEKETPAEFSVARSKMYEVRHFVMTLDNSNEKLMLYYHYIRGESVEKCAELLGISRSSGFRLKRRALERAYIARESQSKQRKALDKI